MDYRLVSILDGGILDFFRNLKFKIWRPDLICDSKQYQIV